MSDHLDKMKRDKKRLEQTIKKNQKELEDLTRNITLVTLNEKKNKTNKKKIDDVPPVQTLDHEINQVEIETHEVEITDHAVHTPKSTSQELNDHESTSFEKVTSFSETQPAKTYCIVQ
jgi:hypothetical protein